MNVTSVHELVMGHPPEIVAGLARYPYSDQLAQRFVAVSRFGETFALYQKRGDKIYLPRAVCPPTSAADDLRAEGDKIDVTCTMKPRDDEQARIINETVAFLKAGQSGILQARTGVGKTVITTKIIEQIGRKTLVVVPKEDLVISWRNELKKNLGLTDDQIGHIQQDTARVEGCPVVIAMIHSISKAHKYDESIFYRFGLVVIDECHRAPAETFNTVLWMFPAKLRLGLSATPMRKDGKEILLHAHIGPVRVLSQQMLLVPKVFRINTPWQCPRRKTKEGYVTKIPHSIGKIGHMLKFLGNHGPRNALIASLTKTAYDKKRSTVVFSDTLDHLQTLRLLLIEAGVPGADIAFYIGGMSEKERNAAGVKPVILATYKMMSEGTNLPWLDTCVLGTPRSDVEQIVGRILREYPDKKPPVVFDLIDQDSSVFVAYARSRQKFFQSIGAEVEWLQ